jgi:hypothetical protein
MAVTKTILKRSKNEVVVKFGNSGGNNQTSTFDLDVDALISTEVIEGTVKINIVELSWSGLTGSNFILTRNGVSVFAGVGDNAEQFYFEGYVDGQENTSDIVVSMSGEIYLYLVLRKNSGFTSKIETAQFGSYDNPAVLGS